MLAASATWLAGCARPPGGQAPARPTAGATTAAADAPPPVVTFASKGTARKADHLELPLRLLIPSIGVDAPVVAVGLTRDWAMDVPERAGDVGWFEYGPRPGMKGNAVLAGHLDWNGVKGVFYRLAEVKPGQSVIVRAANGEQRPYAVEWLEEYHVTAAPVQKVFELLEVPALTLITCGGRWNPATRRYDTRVVIRAHR